MRPACRYDARQRVVRRRRSSDVDQAGPVAVRATSLLQTHSTRPRETTIWRKPQPVRAVVSGPGVATRAAGASALSVAHAVGSEASCPGTVAGVELDAAGAESARSCSRTTSSRQFGTACRVARSSSCRPEDLRSGRPSRGGAALTGRSFIRDDAPRRHQGRQGGRGPRLRCGRAGGRRTRPSCRRSPDRRGVGRPPRGR